MLMSFISSDKYFLQIRTLDKMFDLVWSIDKDETYKNS